MLELSYSFASKVLNSMLAYTHHRNYQANEVVGSIFKCLLLLFLLLLLLLMCLFFYKVHMLDKHHQMADNQVCESQ